VAFVVLDAMPLPSPAAAGGWNAAQSAAAT
jgi:hypothetical protein